MNPPSDYWSSWPEDPKSGDRDFCYMIIPQVTVNPGIVADGDWQNVYRKLGGLGYRFRDAGYCDKYLIISLNKPITDKHKEELMKEFEIIIDRGDELAFI